MYVTTNLSLCYRYLVKILKKWCITHCITMCVTPFRAGFVRCRSRVSNLACYSISESINNKKQVDYV